MDCVERQFEAVGDAEFVKDVVQMIFYGVLADEELFADFLVLKALNDKLNDFHLAVAEERLFTTRTEFGRCRKGIDHPGGHVAIEPYFTSMHAMYAFYEEVDGGLFWRVAKPLMRVGTSGWPLLRAFSKGRRFWFFFPLSSTQLKGSIRINP
jgi:hypothetical protein